MLNTPGRATPKPLSEVTAMVVDCGFFPDLARVLGTQCAKCYYCCPSWVRTYPKMCEAKIGDGFPEIEVCDSIYDHFEDVDLFAFFETGFGKTQQHLESLGKACWGPGLAEDLEFDRVKLKELMAEKKLPVGPYKVIRGIPNLREYLAKNKHQVIKLSKYRGDFDSRVVPDLRFIEGRLKQLESDLEGFADTLEFVVEEELDHRVEAGEDCYCIDGLYPTKHLYGIECKDLCYAGHIIDRAKIPEPLTRFSTAMASEFALLGLHGFYSTETRIGKDKVPFMIDLCFDQETEVLTEVGWKLFQHATSADKFATLNMTTGFIEYQRATQFILKPYRGKMIRITSPERSIDCLVTPDHDVLRYDRHKKRLFKEKAGALSDKGFIPRTGKWVGNTSLTHFTLPEYHHEWNFIGQYKHHICKKVHHEPTMEIPMKDWATFLGWYLSEGSSGAGHYTVNICQTKCMSQVRDILDALPFSYTYDGKKNFTIRSIQLSRYLKRFGLCREKYVPAYIKEAPCEIIRAFLDAFNLGDGSIRNGQKVYYTSSSRLADDLQELIFKIGSVANISHLRTCGTTMECNGKKYTRKGDKYVLHERTRNFDFWFETQKRKSRYITEVDYEGNVYCVTVPNGTLYVRRHGKPFWSGNCPRAGAPPSELYQILYDNLADIIWQGANGICIDPDPVDEWGVQVSVYSEWAENHWVEVQIPDEYEDYLTLWNCVRKRNRIQVMPQVTRFHEIGYIVGHGDSLESAIEMAKEIADSVRGIDIEVRDNTLDDVEGEIEKMKKNGLWPK